MTVYLDKTVPTILAKNGPNHLTLVWLALPVEAEDFEARTDRDHFLIFAIYYRPALCPIAGKNTAKESQSGLRCGIQRCDRIGEPAVTSARAQRKSGQA